MLATTFAHSMVEYPLWYIYFLGIFILFLSIDQPLCNIATKYIKLPAIISIIYIIYLVLTNTIIFKKLTEYTDIPENNIQQFTTQARYLENIIKNNTLLSYPALYTLDDYINPDYNETDKTFTDQQQIFYVTKLTNFHPYPDTLIKQAILYWNTGEHKHAITIVKNTVRAFPVYKADFLDTLQDERYTTLYDIVKKYKYKKSKN